MNLIVATSCVSVFLSLFFLKKKSLLVLHYYYGILLLSILSIVIDICVIFLVKPTTLLETIVKNTSTVPLAFLVAILIGMIFNTEIHDRLIFFSFFQEKIWKKSVSGQMVFRVTSSKKDLRLISSNDKGKEISGGFIQVRGLLGEQMPSHHKKLKGYKQSLMEIYLNVLKTGQEKEIDFQYQGQVEGWFRNRIIPLDRFHLYMDFIDITEIKEASMRDALSGLYNRRYLQEFFDSSQGAIYFDIDKFKRINDDLGHSVGDVFIKEIAVAAMELAREKEGYAFRMGMGSDEFLLLFEEITHAELDQTAIKLFHKTSNIKIQGVKNSCSIGVAFSRTKENTQTLIDKAEYAARLSKNKSHSSQIINKIHVWGQVLENKRIRQNAIKKALDQRSWNNEFWLAYQGIFDLQTGRAVGCEALLRWDLPSVVNLSPGEFIPLAEKSEVIHDIGKWVINRVAETLTDPSIATLNFWISVNISPMELEYGEVAEYIANFSGKNFAVEITERGVVENNSVFSWRLNKIKEAKISLKIDDFGTGTAGLSQLISLPFDTLKIDKSFVPYGTEDMNRVRICSAICSLAKQIGHEVIAEGIETEEQLNFFRQIDCKYGQGYFLGKPVRWEEFKALFLNEQKNRTGC